MNPLEISTDDAHLNALFAEPRDDAGEGMDRYTVPALERGLRLLGAFTDESNTLSAPELVRRFELPRSTVFRLLTTLEGLGFVERCDGGRAYRLGPAVLRLGVGYLATLEATQLEAPQMRRLCEELHMPGEVPVFDGESEEDYLEEVAQRVRDRGNALSYALDHAPAASAKVVPLSNVRRGAEPLL